MLKMRLIDGPPDEPEHGDHDAICSVAGPRQVFDEVLKDIDLPETIHSESEDEDYRVHVFWSGSESFGLKVTETIARESTMFPMRCRWQTFGLPGINLNWSYLLDYEGQLGHAAFRHGQLEASFDSDADLNRFCEMYARVIGKTPVFAALPSRKKTWLLLIFIAALVLAAGALVFAGLRVG